MRRVTSFLEQATDHGRPAVPRGAAPLDIDPEASLLDRPDRQSIRPGRSERALHCQLRRSRPVTPTAPGQTHAADANSSWWQRLTRERSTAGGVGRARPGLGGQLARRAVDRLARANALEIVVKNRLDVENQPDLVRDHDSSAGHLVLP